MSVATDIQLSRDEIAGVLRRHEHGLRGLGVRSLALFGSRAVGKPRPDSDLDVLVELDPMSIYQYARLRRHLSELTHAEVHLATRGSFAPSRRPSALQGAYPVF